MNSGSERIQDMVRRGSVGSASACCKAGPSSILGSAPQGGSSHWAFKRRGDGERPQRMTMDKCIVWMWLNECMYVCYKKNMKNKQKEWHPATKPLKKKIWEGSVGLSSFLWLKGRWKREQWGSGRSQMLGNGLGLWQSRFIYNLNTQLLNKNHISFSAHSSKMNKRLLRH